MNEQSRAQAADAPEFTRARVISRDDYAALQACVTTALDVLEVSIAHVRARPDLQATAVAAHPHAAALLSLVDDPVEAIARFDAFVDAEGVLRFLEYNPGLCGGAFNAYRAGRVFLDSEAGRKLAAEAALEVVDTPRMFIESVWKACRDTLGRDGRVAALIWPDAAPAALSREMEAFAAMQAERGGALLSVGADEVQRHAGALWFGDTRIDAAFVMDWEAMGMAARPLAAPLSDTWIANSLGSGIFRGGKHLFAVMSDPALGAPFTPEQRRWIDRHIPWTRLLPPPQARDENAEALRALAIGRQAEMIIKPSLGRGGKGILAGWAASEDDWRGALERPDADAFIMQERVLPRLEEPFDPAAQSGARVFADLCMFVWDNRIAAGLVSRAAPGWLLNVNAGEARAVPVLVQG
jgi:hypothetical protein